MKTPSVAGRNTITKSLLIAVACAALLAIPQAAMAANLTYNVGANLGWFTTNAWTGNQTWAGGDSASFTTNNATIVTFDGNTTISSLTHNGSQQLTLQSASARTLTFSGGTLNLAASFPFVTNHGVTIQGNLTISGSSGAQFRVDGSTNVSAYNGTMTINGAGFAWGNPVNVGSNSNFVVNGGILNARQTNTTVGSVEMTGGDFQLGRNNADANSFTTTVNKLSGIGGTITTLSRNGNTSLSLNRTLTIDQTVNTTFAGSIVGVNGGARIILNKSGAGSLGLSGNITLARETTVTAGTLLINSTNATFTNESGVNAITVNGTLGGTGTLQITGADSVTLTGNGSLVAGLAGSAGQTTYNLSGGSLDLSTRTASSGTGWLNFDLGTAATAGTTYDRISLTGSGTLNIGTGLNFTDFTFSALSGFGSGNYTLFSTTSTILGTLGTATGTISGLDATLQVSGNDLILNVVPEPSTWALLAVSLTTVMVLRRRRRNS